ncbi:alpha/beta fold hydrolase [Pseudalkalibacillus salsuginis]|uniref:alpha/beta fold hydrolase n=1 Tax=Pseudalkalibacillus salsuginis TaxID=2910972 RepID=UPI001F3D7465|nr:alpha/beta hydrolase [Pseudalkalibacillus salsuginis]MCF6411706.1 alpha/beta hydrolase [Pseudalkalibacillus salsuginis]
MYVNYSTININGYNLFYREAGNKDNPTILLLHGFPSSSHMFRNLIHKLADRYHVIAPDYFGFGYSDQPSMSEFEYTFENLANVIIDFVDKLKLEKYSIYVHDYGAPIGFRLAVKYPDRIEAIISQNGNAYEEGILPSWAPFRAVWKDPSEENKNNLYSLLQADYTKFQYVNGTRNPDQINPDSWNMDQIGLDREGNREIQMALFYDYRNNLKEFPKWQEFFRTYQPPALIAWGKNDMFYGHDGALAYQKDLEDVEVHLLNTGHFPLEEHLEVSSFLIKEFLDKRINRH